MHEMIEKICSRHAVRRFQDRQLEEDVLEQILQAGLHAPSAGNNQRTRIVVCQDRERNARLGRLSRDLQFQGADPNKKPDPVSAEQPSIRDDLNILDGFYHAPTVLTIFAPQTKFTHEDAAMVAENILLAAHFLDVGACYVGRTQQLFATEYGLQVRRSWGIDEDLVAVGNVVLGYREGPEPHAKPRKPGRIVRV